MQRVTILGIPIDAVTQSEAVERLLSFLDSSGQCHVMTPNNEMIVEAQRNPEFKEVLQRTDLNLPDSRGLLFAARWTGQNLPERVTGVDSVQALCEKLSSNHQIFLLGAAPGVAEKAASVLTSRNSQLRIVGTASGSPRNDDADAIMQKINAAQPHLLLVAFGAPQQDLWIAKHLHELPSVRVAMGVGGTFDFIAGVKKRAPGFIRKIGLEWLWRFVQEPWRWRRMWRAVFIFPWLVIRDRSIGLSE